MEEYIFQNLVVNDQINMKCSWIHTYVVFFSKSSKHSDGAEPDEIADNVDDNADDNNEIVFLVLIIFMTMILRLLKVMMIMISSVDGAAGDAAVSLSQC